MASGGKRPGAGRPKGRKNSKPSARTLDKEAARTLLRQMVMERMGPMIEAQVANAQGLKYLVSRDKKTGKFTRLTELGVPLPGEGESEREVIEVWEKDPNVSAFTDLMNRTIDKPIEQVSADVKGNIVISWMGEE